MIDKYRRLWKKNRYAARQSIMGDIVLFIGIIGALVTWFYGVELSSLTVSTIIFLMVGWVAAIQYKMDSMDIVTAEFIREQKEGMK